MQKMANIRMCNAWGAKCNMMYEQEHPTQINSLKAYFMNLPLASLFIHKLTLH
jgi:hypothetical protein